MKSRKISIAGRILTAVLTTLLVASSPLLGMPHTAFDAYAAEAIPYVDAQGNDQTPITDYHVVTADTTMLYDGWNVVTEEAP